MSSAAPAETSADVPYDDDRLAEFGLSRAALPRHVAVIMDGNGRWAEARGLSRSEGHVRGAEVARAVTEEAARLGCEQVTLYCLSSENWKRPAIELEQLFGLLGAYLTSERDFVRDSEFRFVAIGRRTGLPDEIVAAVDDMTAMTAGRNGMRLCLALNYGSRDEIVDATRSLARDVAAGRVTPEEIDEAAISSRLYTAGMPDPDLVIRTAGEMRLSNFLLWQNSYAEFWSTPTCWPDFGPEGLREAFRDYACRTRRFGAVGV